jgi:predicted CopG family antitoxin
MKQFTSVGVTPETKSRLKSVKHDLQAESFDETIHKLIEAHQRQEVLA